MTEPRDPNETPDERTAAGGTDPDEMKHAMSDTDLGSLAAESLDIGLAAAFGKNTGPPRSTIGDVRPVLLKEAEEGSALVVRPTSDAMPSREEAGDRYRLDGEIARGGMGAVLRGRDVDLGRDLAVKVLLEKFANRPDVARRFIEEAQIGGQLQHPGVVPVYDIGKFGDRPFFTMKLVKGQTLAAILGDRTDPATDRPRLLGIALQVAQAMAYAHAKGVIHRDLKPANIMVGAFGEVQVMDWGLAKVLAEGGVADEERAGRAHQQEPPETVIRTARSTGLHGNFGTDTEAGSVLGTPAYMPPEQASGDIPHLDRRADVFALGAILCEILTGKPPYVGRSSEEIRRKAANGDQADATARLAGCGSDLELVALTKQCLSPEAIDRPRNAQAVVDALTSYLDGVQERLQQAERERAVAEARELEERKRRKVQLALAASMLAMMLGIGAFAFWRNEQAQLVRQRDARNAEAVAGLLGQAEEALRAGDAAKAAVALEAAKKRSAEGGAEKEEKRLGRLDADLALLGELDAIDQFRWTVVDNQWPDPGVVATRIRDVLKRFGADPNAGSVPSAAERVSASVVRDRVVPALDGLLRQEKSITVRELLRRVDADPYRDSVRDAILLGDGAKVAELAGQAGARDQPPGFVAFLGENEAIPEERRRQMLLAAVIRRPADLSLLMTLGETFQINEKETVDERLRWSQAAAAAAPANLAALNNLGIALNDKGQFDNAIDCFKRAIELGPKLAIPHNNLGNALRASGRLDEAIACFKKAIELDPKIAVFHSNLGGQLPKRRQLDEAIAFCKKAIELDPKLVSAHINLGAILCDFQRDYNGAVACFKKAIELNPKLAIAHGDLGSALSASGRLDEAIVCFKRAIELEPKHAMAHFNLGNALSGKGQLDEAITCFRKAVELDPRFANAHDGLGVALRDKGQFDEAIICFRKAVELDSKNAVTYSNLGVILRDFKRDYDAAAACFRKAIELDPKNANAQNDLAAILCDFKRDYDGAIACFRKAIELDPKWVIAHFNLGNALRNKGQLDEAIVRYREAIGLDPKHASAHNNLGSALQAKGQLDESIACYKKAIELDPKHAKAHSNLGYALHQRGQLDDAIACYKKAMALDPKPAMLHANLGNALYKKGQLNESIAYYRKSIELAPKNVAAHANLGNALRDNGQLNEAIACYTKAIELAPNLAEARCNLGHALATQGRFAESLEALRQGHVLGSKQPGWRYRSADWVRQAEAKAAMEAKLPAFFKGEFQPNDTAQRLALAVVCQGKKLHHTGAGVYAAAFAADPKLAADLQAAHRYSAACFAALAAAGQGEDATNLDDAERTRLRKQALDWLRADLAQRTKQLETGNPADRDEVQKTLHHWQNDTDLAAIRDAAALAKLPADEQKACQTLWAEVGALLGKLSAK